MGPVTLDTPYREIGNYRRDVWDTTLKAARSPLLPELAAILAVVDAANLGALAHEQARKESGFAADATAQKAKNPLGLMVRKPDEPFVLVADGARKLRVFRSYAEAFTEYVRRLTDPAEAYLSVGVRTLGELIDRYLMGWVPGGPRPLPPGETVASRDLYRAQLVDRLNANLGGGVGPTPAPTPALTDPYAVMFGGAPHRMGDFGWRTMTDYANYHYGVGHGTTDPKMHTGQDVLVPYGTPYFALGPGKVVCVGGAGTPLWGQGCGAFADTGDAGPGAPSLGVGNVTVLYDAGVKVTTGHTRQAFVRPGDRVVRGQKVGTVGGMRVAHLHVDTVVLEAGTYRLIDPADGLRRVVGGAPAPAPPAKPNMTKGLVPLPPITPRFVTPQMKPEGVGWNNIGKREVWGLSRHRMQGTLAGTDDYFHRPDIRALTDLGIDHQTAEMMQWLDPFGFMTPHASGPVNAPYGDGAAFLRKWQGKYGYDVVNRMRVSVEISGYFAQPGTNITADSPWSDLSQRRFAQTMAHYAHDYGIAWDDFPNHPDDGFSFLADHVEFTKGTGKLCAGALVIAATGNVIQLAADILKAAQLGGAKPPAPSPGLAYPDGMDRELAADLFGRVEVAGVVYAYNEAGPVSRLWLDLGITHEPHLFPSIETVRKGEDGEYFFFDNGLVLYRKDDKGAFRAMGDDPIDTGRAA